MIVKCGNFTEVMSIFWTLCKSTVIAMKTIKLQNCKAKLESLRSKSLSFIDTGGKTREVKQLTYEHIRSNLSEPRQDC